MLLSLMLVAGCASVNQTAICDELDDDIDALNVALIEDGGPRSQEAGVAVISGFDGACP